MEIITKNFVEGRWIKGKGKGKPLYDAATGQIIGSASTDGLDFEAILNYGRTVGSKNLSKLDFHQRAKLLKRLAIYLTKFKNEFYEISYLTGATKSDSWIDIEGGFGNLFANASLRRKLPNKRFMVEGEMTDLSRGGNFMAHHIMVPKKGIAIHINAFNFPVWGMLEKCAPNWMAGVAAIVKPATATCFLTYAVVQKIIESGILPEGSIQLICGSARDILDHVHDQDVVTFTGSASTGIQLKSHPKIISQAVPFNMEADSLNCTVLGIDAAPNTPEFKLSVKEVVKEMTVKCGQKCTAIRRILVPENYLEDYKKALIDRLSRITIGHPKSKEVRMGALASMDQIEEVNQKVAELSEQSQVVYNGGESMNLIEADRKRGAFMAPILLQENQPFVNSDVHNIEAFGPVSTIMPYNQLDQAIQLAHLGRGSLCCSIATYDEELATEFVMGAASHHGRILVLNRDSAAQSTGHGSPLPYLIHGGPGRAGGGEEMGGLRGIKHYMQRTAIQGSPTSISNITQVYQPGAKITPTEKHVFRYHYEDIEVGMSITTHKRTITDSDIQNFANLSWDVFYAHTDITSLEGTIFEKRAAHGYFLLSAAAGLFVHPSKGPVGANYGIDECRFLKPVYHNDTIYVRLTCKEKSDRDTKGKNHPAGVVKWYEEIFDQNDELVATATILTLVQKSCPFFDFKLKNVKSALNKLTEDSKPKWGLMSAQNMVEHLEFLYLIALDKTDIPIYTPEEKLEKYQDSLYNYRPIPVNFKSPFMDKEKTKPLKYGSLEEAKEQLFNRMDEVDAFFNNNPDKKVKHVFFGYLDPYMWFLFNRKHFHHHFTQFDII